MAHPLSSNYPAKDSASFDTFIAINVNEKAKKTAIDFVHKQKESEGKKDGK